MGLWDLFRKKPVVENKKILKSEIPRWLEEEKEEIKEKEDKFSSTIKSQLSELILGLEEKISILKKVDVTEKKAEEKIKFIVRENLAKQIAYLDELIDKLKRLNGRDLVKKIESVFSDFQKRSSSSYEKATFLIGKELGDIKDLIRNFLKDIDKTIKENQPILNKLEILDFIEDKLKKSSEIKEINKDVIKKIGELNGKIETKKQELMEIQGSDSFLEQKKKQEKLQKQKQDLEISVGNLRELINFKELSRFFHSFEKEMAIIKSYKENFKQAFEKMEGEDLISLLRESKMQEVKILNQIQEINEKQKQIENLSKESSTSESEENIKKLNSEIKTLTSEKTAEEKKQEKLYFNLKNIEGEILGDLDKINVGVE